ncbi:IS982 family transposase [Candidatus Methylomicrobium oryzae]|jgi:transposase|uniref:IS982 family transposase n=1 Tax=Candidatus Methylomicrobium oryzae TaxID=2802053 RepID=UPI001924E3E9|nr:IS982 family transposase [Methylomicrobium sp. RS1]MBL1265789.1 IS982 family transposase [Methylomicrobium sp. RS1]
MDSLTELYCLLDDFCRVFEPAWKRHQLAIGAKRRQRPSTLSLAELMTLAILFHQLRFRQFKLFYLGYVCRHLRAEFPRLPSYQRCVELLPRCAAPLAALFNLLKGECDGISIADATALAVCDNRRIRRHQVFKGLAQRGKTSMGWFYGFKLHAIINSKGELIRLKLTPGNVDDRRPIPELCQGLFGQLFADKGYLSKELAETLARLRIQLITPLRKNMKPVPRTEFEKAILRRRALIETVFDELKNLCQIEHTRHRSVANFVVNLMAGIIAYCLSDNKPTLSLIRVNLLPQA